MEQQLHEDANNLRLANARKGCSQNNINTCKLNSVNKHLISDTLVLHKYQLRDDIYIKQANVSQRSQ